MNQKGWAPILIVLILAALAGGYLVYQNQPKPTPSPQPTTQPSPTSDPTANWKTFNVNQKAGKYGTAYNFSIKYPPSWKPREHDSGTTFDLTLLSPDYQTPTTGIIEEVLNGVRIQISIIQKDKKFSSLQDWFNNFYIDPRSRTVLYKSQQIMINTGSSGQIQGLQYDNMGQEKVPGSEGKILAKLFAIGDIVYEFKIISKDNPIKQTVLLDQILSTFKFLP